MSLFTYLSNRISKQFHDNCAFLGSKRTECVMIANDNNIPVSKKIEEYHAISEETDLRDMAINVAHFKELVQILDKAGFKDEDSLTFKEFKSLVALVEEDFHTLNNYSMKLASKYTYCPYTDYAPLLNK